MQKDDFKEALFWKIQRVIEKIYGTAGGEYGEILMCHEVSDDTGEWYNKDYSVKSSSMITFISELLAFDYKFESISNIEKRGKKRIFLTFDDGFSSVYQELYPYLIKNRIPFCVFVTVDFILANATSQTQCAQGTESSLYLATARGSKYLTLEMLQEISKYDFVDIGAHTISHPVLRKLSRRESWNEIHGSKEILEKMIQKEVKYFAYPYGCLSRCSYRNIRQAKQCGYSYAFSTLDAPIKLFGKYFIPRRNVSESSLVDLRKKLLDKGEKNE